MHRDSGFAGRLEVVETGRRRRWSVAEKMRIVVESLAGDRQGSATARRYRITNSLLFKWRKAYREGGLGEPKASAGFVPAVIIDEDNLPERVPALSGGLMEIVLAADRRVIVGADVDAAALGRVLGVLAGSGAHGCLR